MVGILFYTRHNAPKGGILLKITKIRMRLTSQQRAYGLHKCRACGRIKALDEFHQWIDAGDYIASHCINCCAKRNPRIDGERPTSKHRATKREQKHRGMLNKLKAVPCADCGRKFPPVCMDFDHRPEAGKSFNIAASLFRSTDALLAEVAKCDVVCACCHRLRSAARGWSGGRPRA